MDAAASLLPRRDDDVTGSPATARTGRLLWSRERDHDMPFRVAVPLAAGVALTQVLDAMSTLVGLSAGASELNPIMDGLISSYGPATFVAVKAAAGVVLAGWMWRRAVWSAGLTAFMSAVVVWNLSATLVLL